MSVLGFSFAPFGLSIFGYGSVDEANILKNHLLEEYPNGPSQNARFIDPYTRDYVLDANGIIKGQSSISQQVYLALVTDLGSAAVSNVGNEFFKVKTIDESTSAKLKNYVNKALSNLINNNLIRIIDIETNNLPAGISIKVVWQDTSNNRIEITALNHND